MSFDKGNGKHLDEKTLSNETEISIPRKCLEN
jgi:hypothetical protein